MATQLKDLKFNDYAIKGDSSGNFTLGEYDTLGWINSENEYEPFLENGSGYWQFHGTADSALSAESASTADSADSAAVVVVGDDNVAIKTQSEEEILYYDGGCSWYFTGQAYGVGTETSIGVSLNEDNNWILYGIAEKANQINAGSQYVHVEASHVPDYSDYNDPALWIQAFTQAANIVLTAHS